MRSNSDQVACSTCSNQFQVGHAIGLLPIRPALDLDRCFGGFHRRRGDYLITDRQKAAIAQFPAQIRIQVPDKTKQSVGVFQPWRRIHFPTAREQCS